jgi:hypothetical protein
VTTVNLRRPVDDLKRQALDAMIARRQPFHDFRSAGAKLMEAFGISGSAVLTFPTPSAGLPGFDIGAQSKHRHEVIHLACVWPIQVKPQHFQLMAAGRCPQYRLPHSGEPQPRRRSARRAASATRYGS